MADWPSGFVLMVILPLASLLFFACGLWSATLLLRIRKDGVRFAVPFLICALPLLALVYAPLQQIYLQHDFRARPRRPRADRGAGRERRTDSQCRRQQEPEREPYVSAGGNDIVIDDRDEASTCCF